MVRLTEDIHVNTLDTGPPFLKENWEPGAVENEGLTLGESGKAP